MLLEIARNQMIETRREEIAQDEQEAITAFHRGELKTQPLEVIISELKATLIEDYCRILFTLEIAQDSDRRSNYFS